MNTSLYDVIEDKRYKLLKNCYAYVSENSGNLIATIEGTHKNLTDIDRNKIEKNILKFEKKILKYFNVSSPSYFIEIEK